MVRKGAFWKPIVDFLHLNFRTSLCGKIFMHFSFAKAKPWGGKHNMQMEGEEE